jgi:hypothetical protein
MTGERRCQAKGCKCPLEAYPMVIECDDGSTVLGFFCPCHTLLTFAAVCELYEETEYIAEAGGAKK